MTTTNNRLEEIRARLDRLELAHGQILELASTDTERAYENTISDLIGDARILLSLLDARPDIPPDTQVDETALAIAVVYEREFLTAWDNAGGYGQKQIMDLARCITAYGDRRAEEAGKLIEPLFTEGDRAEAIRLLRELRETNDPDEIQRQKESWTQLEATLNPACTWAFDPDGYWITSCGDQFCITDGSPAENRMVYCHYCGRKLVPSRAPRLNN